LLGCVVDEEVGADAPEEGMAVVADPVAGEVGLTRLEPGLAIVLEVWLADAAELLGLEMETVET
jgi:hypothetical protein